MASAYGTVTPPHSARGDDDNDDNENANRQKEKEMGRSAAAQKEKEMGFPLLARAPVAAPAPPSALPTQARPGSTRFQELLKKSIEEDANANAKAKPGPTAAAASAVQRTPKGDGQNNQTEQVSVRPGAAEAATANALGSASVVTPGR